MSSYQEDGSSLAPIPGRQVRGCLRGEAQEYLQVPAPLK